MSTTGIRSGFHSLNPYLQAVEAKKLIDFLKAAFLAEVGECFEENGHVRHAELRIGDSMIEVSEPRGVYTPTTAGIHYYVPDVDAVYARAVAAGATSIAAPTDHPYGERGASIQDPCGNFWYLARCAE
jgi:PhnB protein